MPTQHIIPTEKDKRLYRARNVFETVCQSVEIISHWFSPTTQKSSAIYCTSKGYMCTSINEVYRVFFRHTWNPFPSSDRVYHPPGINPSLSRYTAFTLASRVGSPLTQ